MKKLLLVLTVLFAVVTLSACDTTEFIDFTDQITQAEADIAALEADIAALEASGTASDAEIAALEAQLLDLMSKSSEEIIIMHTNDVHGTANYDKYRGLGLATLATAVNNVRDEYAYTYLVDAGDMFHGTTFATLEEGESMVTVMNAVGYDLMVPGNHDFDYGQDRFLELVDMANFPIISANIQYDADDSDMLDPYYIEEFGDVTVGFFGLTSPETSYKTHPDNVIGINFLDPIAQATAMVAELESQVDVIILLAHIGLDSDTLITTEDIANAVDGIDVIIDGHSHSYLETGMIVGDTLIASAGQYGKHLGGVSITVSDTGVVSTEILDIDEDVAPDLFVQYVIDVISAGQAGILNEVLGSTAVKLDGIRDLVRTGETNLGMIITDAMIDVTGADIAITNGGGIRADIAAGEVTMGDVITVLPFGNMIQTVELTGQEVVDMLEYGTSSAPDASGKFPHVAGITFTLDLNAAAGSRVSNVMVGGVAIDLTATYLVATNDFLAAGGDGYTVFEGKTRVGEFMGLHEALEAVFTEADGDIVIPTDVRITIIAVVE